MVTLEMTEGTLVVSFNCRVGGSEVGLPELMTLDWVGDDPELLVFDVLAEFGGRGRRLEYLPDEEGGPVLGAFWEGGPGGDGAPEAVALLTTVGALCPRRDRRLGRGVTRGTRGRPGPSRELPPAALVCGTGTGVPPGPAGAGTRPTR